MEENQKIPMRSQVKKEDTWAIEDMYATVEDWEKDFAAAKKVAEEAAEYAGRLGESAQALYDLSLIHIFLSYRQLPFYTIKMLYEDCIAEEF